MAIAFKIHPNGKSHEWDVEAEADGERTFSDRGDLRKATTRERIAKRVASRLGGDERDAVKALDAEWDRLKKADRDRPPQAQAEGEEFFVEVLGRQPDVIRRPLALIDTTAYAATWVHTRTTVTRSRDPKTGAVVTHEPPLAQTRQTLAVARSDGAVFAEVPAPGFGPLGDVGVTVELLAVPPPDRLWSGAGLQRFARGEKPAPARVFRRLAEVVDRFIDFHRS